MKLYLLIFSISLNFLENIAFSQNTDAINPHWLAIVHYEKLSDGSYVSEIDQKDFFVHPEGRTRPDLELEALYSKRSDDQVRCRFPARFKVIETYLKRSLPNFSCDVYHQWKEKNKSDTVSLVHAAQYAGNPASLFGHTFLKFSLKHSTSPRPTLIDLSVGYFANMPEDTPLYDYVIKGVFGGFKGHFLDAPFHKHLFEYGSIENRNLWEYDVDLSAEQVDLLLDHIWEMSINARLDYYYLDDNCAYRILTMFDAVNPKWKTADLMKTYVIPSDSVTVLYDAGHLNQINFRPSATEILVRNYDELSSKQRRSFHALIHFEKKPSDIDSNEVLETFVHYVDHLQLKQKGHVDDNRLNQRDEALLKRSQLGGQRKPEHKSVDLSRGVHAAHGPYMVSALAGKDNSGESFQQIEARVTAHGLMDPSPGFDPGSELRLLHGKWRKRESRQLQLEELTIVQVSNIEAFHLLRLNPSWQTAFGVYRQSLGVCDHCLIWQGKLSAGLGVPTTTKKILPFALGRVDAHHMNHPRSLSFLSFGWDVGVLFDLHQNLKLLFKSETKFFRHKLLPNLERKESVIANYRLLKNWSVRGEFFHNKDLEYREGLLGLKHYF